MLGHEEQQRSGIQDLVGVLPEPATVGVRVGYAHRRGVDCYV